jgi:GTP-binding protein Era
MPPKKKSKEQPPPTRSGFVSLLGAPNVGKTTLLNALVDRKVGIVSSKPQTTRNRITGIRTTEACQIVFVDHPGFHKPQYLLNREMMRLTRSGLRDSDLLLLVMDASEGAGPLDRELLELVKGSGLPRAVVLNKIDKLPQKERLLPLMESLHHADPGAELIPLSALRKDGVAALATQLEARMPEGPFLFPPDQWTTQSETFYLSELIREKVLHACRAELPYAVAVEIEHVEEDEAKGLMKIYARILVEREGQKAIIIGKRGEMAKTIGTKAREEMEAFLGIKVFLGLQVSVAPRWREDSRVVSRLLPPEEAE